MQQTTWRKVFIGVTLVLAPTLAFPQQFAAKPVRFVVGYAAGGVNDIVARIVTAKLSGV